MEGAGVAESTWELASNYLVIRGINDYCNNKKNDDWKLYSALVAAAFTRYLIDSF